jgi:hypothetical protein
MSTKDGPCLATGRHGGGRSTAKPSDRGTLGHKPVVALIALVVMSAVMAPRAGTALASPSSGSVSARPAPLTTASAVTLGVRLVVSQGDGPVRAEVTGPGLTTLRALVRGTRAPGGPSPDHQATPVGTLWISGGDHPGVDRVSVEAHLNGVALVGSLGFEWRMVSAPAGSQAALTAPDTASPVIQPDRPGSYDLQVTVRDRPAVTSGGPASEQPVVLTARPDDPPLGVPIETLSAKPDGHVQIDDQPVARTTDPHGIYFAVLDRATRAVVESDTVTPDRQGVDRLDKVVDKWSRVGTLGYLMVVSSTGVGVSVVDPLSLLVQRLGHVALDLHMKTELIDHPFSFLGIPGAATGSGAAWSYIHSFRSGGTGNMTGVLRLNVATGRYDLVSPNHPTIDTRAAGTTSDTNVIRVGDTTYAARLPVAGSSGLHVLALNPDTLAPFATDLNNRAWATNRQGQGVATDINDQKILAMNIARLASNNPRPLFIIQSIGGVRPRQASLGTEIGKLGGNSAVFNALNGPGGYALIGRAAPGPADVTAESSSSAGQSGHLAGVLSRDRSWTFRLLASDPSGSLNTDLLTIADQPAQSFPAFDTPGEQAADDYIARQLNYCGDMPQTTCELRREYYLDSRASWATKYTTLSNLRFPSGQQRFTRVEFDRVWSQLLSEVPKVSEVFVYLNELKKPFQSGQLQSYVDLQAIAKAVEDAVRPPAADITASGWAVLNKILSYGKTVTGLIGPPELKILLDVISAGVMLAQDLSTNSGSPAIGDVIKAKTTELGSRLLAGYRTSEQSITGAGLLIVSDYGRLNAAAGKVNGAWKLPPDDTKASIGMRYAAQAWFYQILLPLAYPNFLQISPPPSLPTTPQSYGCIGGGNFPRTYFPLKNLADSAQTPQIVDFDNNGVALTGFALVAGRRENDGRTERTPPGSLTDPLFAPFKPDSTSARPDLGLNNLAFYSGRTWPTRKIIHNNGPC